MKTVQEQIDALMEAFPQGVELHSELQSHLYDGGLGLQTLHHKYVIMPLYTTGLAHAANEQYRIKTERCAKALEQAEYATYIWLHERPYRIDALYDLIELGLLNGAEYWELVAEVWIDSENIREHPDAWAELLGSDMPGRDAMMFDYEHMALAALPDTFFIYQGHTGTRDDGWSWTTEYETARWFGYRFAMLEDDTPALSSARVSKSDVLAMFTRRGEMEILVNPACVRDLETKALPSKEAE